MTNTTSTTNTDTAATTAEAAATLTVRQLDPRTLLLDNNIRTEVRLDKDFIESVRQHGVLVPIVAVRTADGGVRVRHGQRRTLGAIAADRPTVPVVVGGDEGATDTAEIDRIITQHAENTHRAGLTHGEQVKVVEQLALLGVSAAQITKRTRMRRADVDAGLVITGSEVAAAALERHAFLDLAQAAVLAEFEGDEETVTALVAAASSGRFDHVAQRARDDRDTAQRIAAHAAALTAQGVTVITGGAAGLPLRQLRTPEREQITPETHTACPGHAAQVVMAWGYLDPATGQPVPDDEMTDEMTDTDLDGDLAGEDEETHPDDEATPGDGHGPELVYGQYPATQWICTDPAGNGHVDAYAYAYASGSGRQKLADMDPAQAETARAEKRDVRESNAAWRSAEAVRRQWVTTLCARKTPPAGAAVFVTTALALDADVLTGYQRGQLVAELLGVSEYRGAQEVVTQAGQASDTRAHVLTLALVLAAYEANTLVGDWRSVRTATRRYLGFLDACGYTRSDVERRACGQDPLPADTAE